MIRHCRPAGRFSTVSAMAAAPIATVCRAAVRPSRSLHNILEAMRRRRYWLAVKMARQRHHDLDDRDQFLARQRYRDKCLMGRPRNRAYAAIWLYERRHWIFPKCF